MLEKETNIEESYEELEATEINDQEFDSEFEELNEDGSVKSQAAKTKDYKSIIKKLELEKKEYLDGWQRARADIANLQEEVKAVQKKSRALGVESVVYDMLSVIDSFDSAMKNKTAWEAIDANWRLGIEYIKSQAEKVLSDYGVLKINTEIGDPFDSINHESAGTEFTTDETQEHKVAQVLQNGYTMNGKVLRGAKIILFELEPENEK